MESRQFKYEVLICYWLAIHLERFDIAVYLQQQDSVLEKLMNNIRKQGKD